MASSIVRDLFSNDYDRILVDHPRTFRNIKNYIQAVAPQMVPVVQLYNGKEGIFKSNKLQKDLEEVFESRVELPSGGYLFIERTEAMHVVDVNSGRSGRGMKQEDNSLKVNLEAARVLARQVRLRDLGGIIVIDFIDMRHESNKRKVYDELRKQFYTDRAVTKILPMSDFGLMQITRQRLRPSITTTFSGPDASSVNGNGSDSKEQDDKKERQDNRKAELSSKDRHSNNNRNQEHPRPDQNRPARQDAAPRPPREKVEPALLLKEMEKWVTTYKSKGRRGAVTLKVHPFTAAYLNRKVPNHPTRWFLKHRVRIRLEVDAKLDPMVYRFIEVRSGKDITEIPAPDAQGS
jgi:ribonuclease G